MAHNEPVLFDLWGKIEEILEDVFVCVVSIDIDEVEILIGKLPNGFV
jgi:hypothetical protein